MSEVFSPGEEDGRSPLYQRYSIELNGAEDAPLLNDYPGFGRRLHTTRGDVDCLLYEPRNNADGAVIFVPGGRGGFNGPGREIFKQMAQKLIHHRIASLRVTYRLPANLDECVLDALSAVWYLSNLGYKQMAIVGHSFGGAVAISTARYTTHIRGVAALSSQSYGAEDVVLVSPRPLLLVHGDRDGIIPPSTAQIIYDWAFEPKRLEILAGAGHSLEECSTAVQTLLMEWLIQAL